MTKDTTEAPRLVKTSRRATELEPHEVERWAHATTAGSVGRKAVLQYLAARADERGSCFPGQQKMAEATEQGHRTVERHIAELTRAGLLCHHARSRTDGRGRSSDRYFLHVDGQCARSDCPNLSQDQPANLAVRTMTNPPTEHDQPATGGGGGNFQENFQTFGAEQPGPNLSPGSPRRPTKKRGSQLPDAWAPKESHRALAAKHGVHDIDHEAEQFRNHHQAKGSVMVDWDAAFRTWLGNNRRFSGRHLQVVNGRPYGAPDDAVLIDGVWIR